MKKPEPDPSPLSKFISSLVGPFGDAASGSGDRVSQLIEQLEKCAANASDAADPSGRNACLELGELGDRVPADAIRALASVVASKTSAGLRSAAAHAIRRLAPVVKDMPDDITIEATTLLCEATAGQDADVRRCSFQALGSALWRPDYVCPVLHEQLTRESDPAVLETVIETIGKYASRLNKENAVVAATDLSERAMSKAQPVCLRVVAVRALGQFRPTTNVIKALEDLLCDENDSVRQAAIGSLELVSSAAARACRGTAGDHNIALVESIFSPVLTQLLNVVESQPPREQKMALAAIGRCRFGPDVITTVFSAALKDAPVPRRRAAVRGLGEMLAYPDQVLPLLVFQGLRDNDEEVKNNARGVLKEIFKSAALVYLEQAIMSNPTDNFYWADLVRLIAEIDPNDGRRIIQQARSSPDQSSAQRPTREAWEDVVQELRNCTIELNDQTVSFAIRKAFKTFRAVGKFVRQEGKEQSFVQLSKELGERDTAIANRILAIHSYFQGRFKSHLESTRMSWIIFDPKTRDFGLNEEQHKLFAWRAGEQFTIYPLGWIAWEITCKYLNNQEKTANTNTN